MRGRRIVSVLVVGGLLGLLPIAPSTASAPALLTPTRWSAPAAVPADPPVEYKVTSCVVTRKVKIKGETRRRLFLIGKVTPRQGPVIIEMARRCNREPFRCNFKRYDKRKVIKSRYKARITASPTHRSFLWRARVRTSYSDIWRTCVEEPCRMPFPKDPPGDDGR